MVDAPPESDGRAVQAARPTGALPWRADMPLARPGQVIGLLGGSFDPAHEGHVRLTQEALKQFGLDRVWWLVSPGNPLKQQGPAAMGRRMERAGKVMRHPRVEITGLEADLGTRYTAQTLRMLVRLYPGVRFVWLMGADNLATLHHWQDWQWIMQNIPVGVLARPKQRLSARLSPAARRFRRAKLPDGQARRLASAAPPVWSFVNMPMLDISSTKMRIRGDWPQES